VTYLVSGGGAAKPVEVERKPETFIKTSFPNCHFVGLVLNGDTVEGKMYRVADPKADAPTWEVKDTFTVQSK
jgi:hypothetical protein